MAKGILEVRELPSPLGRVLRTVERPNGLVIEKRAVSMGVIAIIYESRPNVTSDAAALCIKSGNACVLRCGKEAHKSAVAIVEALRHGLVKAGLSENTVMIVEDTTRESANVLMTANGLVDLLIPRGGKGLIDACIKNATVPCIETGTGICHIYVDEYVDFNKALAIIENAKTSRPSVCNAAEQLIVHKSIANEFLPLLKAKIGNKVEFRADSIASLILDVKEAKEEDFKTEFLDYILGVQIVDDIDNAIKIISKNSTHHSDAIITENE
jgi:glutamate-5-semialdehyde dehydrogenase